MARLVRDSVRMTVTRRVFLEALATTAGSALLGSRSMDSRSTSAGLVASVLRVGLVASDHAGFADAARGAAMGVGEARHVARMLDRDVSLHQSADPLHLVRADRVHALIGGFDAPSAALLADLAERHDVLFLNIGCPADALRGERCRWRSLHIAASEAMRRDALALLDHDRGSPGDVVLWHPNLERYGAAQLNDRYRAAYQRPMSAEAWSAWMAVKIIAEAAVRLRTFETTAVLAWLEDARTRFDGHKGRALSIRRWDHQLRQPLYWVEAPGAASIVELPPPIRGGAQAPMAEQLDQLGTSAAESACRWTER